MNWSLRSILSIAAKSLLSGSVLYFLFRFVTPADIVTTFRSAETRYVAAAFLLIPVQVFFRTFRWRLLLGSAGVSVTMGKALRDVLVGHAFNTVTPAEIGDFAARLSLGGNAPRSVTLAMTVADKVCDSVGTFTVGIPALVWIMTRDSLLTAGSFLAICVLWWIAFRYRRLAGNLQRIAPASARERVGRVTSSLTSIASRTFRHAGLATAAVMIVVVIQEYLLLQAVTNVGALDTAIGFWSGMVVRNALPFFIGGLGIREATHVYFFGLVGVPAAAAMSTAFLMFAVNTVTPALVGLLLFLLPPKKQLS